MGIGRGERERLNGERPFRVPLVGGSTSASRLFGAAAAVLVDAAAAAVGEQGVAAIVFVVGFEFG